MKTIVKNHIHKRQLNLKKYFNMAKLTTELS